MDPFEHGLNGHSTKDPFEKRFEQLQSRDPGRVGKRRCGGSAQSWLAREAATGRTWSETWSETTVDWFGPGRSETVCHWVFQC